MTARADDAGQVLPLVAVVVAVALGVVVVLGQVGRVLDDAARARTAADAAALAGAAEGPEAAAELARRNGGVLERLEQRGADTVVTVRVGRATATATATATDRQAAGPAPIVEQGEDFP